MPELPQLENEWFFIAPIGADGSEERNRSDGVLEFIVARAAEELNLTAVRADKISEPGQITLQVIDHLLGAKVAVADLTGLNPNVFYELAVRHTARLPVALIAQKGSDLPFDIAQMRTIFFDHTDLRSADLCRQDIVSHLRSALEGGAVDSPIGTSIDVKTLAGGSAVERNVAEIVTTVEDMAKWQRTTATMVETLLRHGVVRESPLDYRAMDALASALNHLSEVRELAGQKNDAELIERLAKVQQPLRFVWERSRRQLSRAPRATASWPSPPSSGEDEQATEEEGC